MIYYFSLEEVITLHAWAVEATWGPLGIRDQRGLKSAVAQPRQAFEGQDLYPTLAAKACALAFSLIRNHPFVDGNKRAGYYSLETFLLINGAGFEADTDDAVSIIEGVGGWSSFTGAVSGLDRSAPGLISQAWVGPARRW